MELAFPPTQTLMPYFLSRVRPVADGRSSVVSRWNPKGQKSEAVLLLMPQYGETVM